jgi:hypothetical protein
MSSLDRRTPVNKPILEFDRLVSVALALLTTVLFIVLTHAVYAS